MDANLLVHKIKACLRVSKMEKGKLYILMVIFMKVVGNMVTKEMHLVYILGSLNLILMTIGQTEINMKENSNMMHQMERVRL